MDQPPDTRVASPLSALIRLQQQARGFSFLHRQPVHSLLSGRRASRIRGRGLSLEKIRGYRPGDNVRLIDWGASARTGHTQTRVFTEERDRPMLPVVDLSAAVFFGSIHAVKSAIAAEVAALADRRGLRAGDRLGALRFREGRIEEFRPRRSRASVMRILGEVARRAAALVEAPPRPADPAELNGALRRAEAIIGHDWMIVVISAMTPVRFAKPPRFPDLAPQGRVVVLPEATTVPGTERVSRESFAALQHSYDLIPAEPGDLVPPGLELRASIGGPDGRPMEATATAPELRVSVRPAPPGVPDLTRLAVAPVVRLTASTDRAPEGLRVGQAVTCTVHMEADGTAALLRPPALCGTPNGVAVHPDPPIPEDRTDRGMLRALRMERATHVPQRPGPVELPGFCIAWLDPRSGQVRELERDRRRPARSEA